MIEVRGYLKKVFDSRFRKVSDDIINFCAEEIDKMNLTEEMLIDGTEDIINDDEMAFTLPKIKKAYRYAKTKWLEKNNRLLPYDEIHRCEYCKNTGITIYALKFNKTGKLISRNTVLRCHCGYSSNDLKHTKNIKGSVINTRDGYIKAYTAKQYAYVMPLINKTEIDTPIYWGTDINYKKFLVYLESLKPTKPIETVVKEIIESIPKFV